MEDIKWAIEQLAKQAEDLGEGELARFLQIAKLVAEDIISQRPSRLL